MTNSTLTPEQTKTIERMLSERMENTGETRLEAMNNLADCLTGIMNQIVKEKSN